MAQLAATRRYFVHQFLLHKKPYGPARMHVRRSRQGRAFLFFHAVLVESYVRISFLLAARSIGTGGRVSLCFAPDSPRERPASGQTAWSPVRIVYVAVRPRKWCCSAGLRRGQPSESRDASRVGLVGTPGGCLAPATRLSEPKIVLDDLFHKNASAFGLEKNRGPGRPSTFSGGQQFLDAGIGAVFCLPCGPSYTGAGNSAQRAAASCFGSFLPAFSGEKALLTSLRDRLVAHEVLVGVSNWKGPARPCWVQTQFACVAPRSSMRVSVRCAVQIERNGFYHENAGLSFCFIFPRAPKAF